MFASLAPRGMNAVDAGAWYGPWTYWLARRCRQVWAFEPNPALATRLRNVVPPNVTVYENALSDVPGEATLHVPTRSGADALATLHPDHAPSGAQAVTVQLRRLDDFDLPQLGFIKIDVESHEREVLAGAESTLRAQHPKLLIEIEQRFFDWPITDLFKWIEDIGYAGWVRRDRRWTSLRQFEVEADQLDHVDNVKSRRYLNNFLFVPAAANGYP